MSQKNVESSLHKVDWLPTNVCAWCGCRQPTDAHRVVLARSSTRHGRGGGEWKFYAPICSECKPFVERLQANGRKVLRIIAAFCFALALIPAYFVALDELVLGIIVWPFFGILITGFLMFPIDWQWLSRLGVRQEPPLGYASKGWLPCRRAGRNRLQFYNEAYHALLVARLPDRAAPISSEGVPPAWPETWPQGRPQANQEKELRRIIESGNAEQIEIARDRVAPELVPTLASWYWRASDWTQKRAIVELLQDQSGPGLRDLMLDFLRAPLESGDERTELAKAAALRLIDPKYDRFMDYYNDRNLLTNDIKEALRAHRLQG